jgi:hypothetical protein
MVAQEPLQILMTNMPRRSVSLRLFLRLSCRCIRYSEVRDRRVQQGRHVASAILRPMGCVPTGLDLVEIVIGELLQAVTGRSP